MSRSGYSDDLDNWNLICWRGQVASAIRGKRGQAFLKELLEALESMPEKRLIKSELIQNGEVCALGALGVKRGMSEQLEGVDLMDYEGVAGIFDIAHQLAQEIVFENDDQCSYMTPEKRWEYMREWVKEQIKGEK